uniref:Ig-like domain-containing protein n=1 Tax=Pavo cristatus TaxID=9049 RepID=A0A8C9FBD7_PAVCR
MGQKESFQTHSLHTSAQLPAEGISGTSPKPQRRPYWLLGPPSATSKARAALRSEQPLHHPAASVWRCTTDTMQPHAILLLFFFPGTWAEPEGSHMLKLLHFATFQNSTSVLVGGLGLLGDVEMGSLDSRTGNIHYYRPWLRPSLPKGDWDVIESCIKSYVRDFSRLVQMYTTVPYPFVFQSSMGCELHPNRTIRTFFDIAYEGQNFLRFCPDTGTWDQMQHNQLSATAEHLMANASTLNEVIQVLLNNICVDILRIFIQAGKADLERQAGPAQLLLVCRVTSFYPRPIAVTWLRDGREVPPSPALSTGTVLPNADLTYQLRSTLLVSPRDGHSYACRVQHCSLGDRSLLVSWEDSKRGLSAGLGAVLLLAAAAVAAVLVRRYRKRQRVDEERSIPLAEHRSAARDGTAAEQYGGCGRGPPALCPPPEELQFFQLFYTLVLDNVSSAELAGMALLADVPIMVLDPHTWNLNICRPWVQEVTAESELKKILSFSMVGIRNTIRFMHEIATKAGLDYPLVFQIHTGCKLYANGTRWSFVNIGEGGRDLVTYDLSRERWVPQRSTPLAKLMSNTLTDLRAVSGFLEHVFSTSFPNYILMLHKEGRTDLERRVPPIAVVFARTAGPAQLLLVCRVTSFYPRPIAVTWLRDGREVPPSPALSTGTVLPNADLTYQLRSTLLVSPRDGHSYACRVQHCSLGDRSLLVPWGRGWGWDMG